jgi:DNA mismatch repair protein MutS
MTHLEHDKSVKKNKENLKSIPKNNYQLSMFELDPKFQEAKEMIEKIDINAISPIEALLKLHEIKKKINS